MYLVEDIKNSYSSIHMWQSTKSMVGQTDNVNIFVLYSMTDNLTDQGIIFPLREKERQTLWIIE